MKPAGVHDIARLAKVSIGTVDRALHGRPGISLATRERILRIARKVGYTPNPTARALSVRRSSAASRRVHPGRNPFLLRPDARRDRR